MPAAEEEEEEGWATDTDDDAIASARTVREMGRALLYYYIWLTLPNIITTTRARSDSVWSFLVEGTHSPHVPWCTLTVGSSALRLDLVRRARLLNPVGA